MPAVALVDAGAALTVDLITDDHSPWSSSGTYASTHRTRLAATPDTGGPGPVTARFADAVSLATALHAGDIRKGTRIPYIAHLLGVCSMVLADGGDEDEAIAALLHDALEDHGDRITAAELERRYGPRVAALVVSCSDTPAGFAGGAKPPWRQRKEGYLDHVRASSPHDLRVSLADKLYNARAILADLGIAGDSVWSRFKAGRDGQLWYYRALVDAFRVSGVSGRMFDEFVVVVTALETETAIRT